MAKIDYLSEIISETLGEGRYSACVIQNILSGVFNVTLYDKKLKKYRSAHLPDRENTQGHQYATIFKRLADEMNKEWMNS